MLLSVLLTFLPIAVAVLMPVPATLIMGGGGKNAAFNNRALQLHLLFAILSAPIPFFANSDFVVFPVPR